MSLRNVQIEDHANSPYLLNIDKISKSEWTPAQSFRPNKIWYFERLRGQFLFDKLSEGTSGSNKVRKFLEARPKDMLLLVILVLVCPIILLTTSRDIRLVMVTVVAKVNRAV